MDEFEYERAIEQYTEPLLRQAYFYTKNKYAAEDIVQDVWIKFYETNGYDEQGQLAAYLHKMTYHKCLDYLKSWSYKKCVVKEKIEHLTKGNPIELAVLNNEQSAMIEKAILKLSLKLREPIVLFYYEELKIKDIAIVLSIPESTVKSRLTKAKLVLKELIGDMEEGELADGI
jgi:RNA polymerase sigma factor (sigma-70 family)